ncbi:MAG: thiamine-phosphate kinase [Vulcanococcus sp.]
MAGAAGSAETLADLGEWELLRRLAVFAPPGQFADDAALLQERADRQLVVNTDVLVEGVHFSDATMPAQAVGWRAAAANLSDLAAMGCTAVAGLTVGMVAPGCTPWAWVEGVYQGLEQALQQHGGVLLGGDCSSGQQRLLAITALGHVQPQAGPIRRSDGRPGDWLLSTGPHGLSRLGLALLLEQLAPEQRRQLSPNLQDRAIPAHQRPRPRLDAVAALHASQPQAQPWRVGGTDSSDGLAAAVAGIAAASGCGAALQRSALPLDPELGELEQGERWCLSGGEDFELILALDPSWGQALLQALPGSRRIGTLVTGAAGGLHWQENGEPLAAGSAGFCHFQ